MEGKLKTESWTDPNGTRHSRVVVQGHQLVMLERKSSTHRFLEQGMVSESMEWLNESAPALFAPPVGRRERAEELV